MPAPVVRLEIVRPGQPAQVVPIERTPFSIGSDATGDLVLDEPGIAPRHAQIVLLGGAYRLIPAAAGAGLVLDGATIPSSGRRLVQGSMIGFGSSCLALRFLVEGGRRIDREDRLSTLMDVARTITSSLKVDEVLERVIEGAVRFSGAERGYLFLKEGDRLVPWTRGQSDARGIEVSHSVAEEVARTGKPIYRDHLGDDEGRPVTASIVRLRLQAILCLPLAVRQDVIGVVYLDSRKPLPHHGPDLPWLEALAGLAAIAILNSRLVEERLVAERTLAIGQMARAIVHDLRSPLSSIRGLADLLLGRASDADPARPHLATIIAEADRLTQITGDLLQFSRDATVPLRAPARLADLVRNTLAPFEARLDKAAVRADLDLDEAASASVDAPRILRLLHNLVANALEAMPDGGTLALRCRRDNGHGVIEVGDNGCGMPEEVRRRIFEPFFSYGKKQGTGLGMAIVRKIVEEHGGAIRVDSAPGQGTLVVVTLPVAPTAP